MFSLFPCLHSFDLIYLVLDQPNEQRDRRLAKHLVSLYYEVKLSLRIQSNPLPVLTVVIHRAGASQSFGLSLIVVVVMSDFPCCVVLLHAV